MFDANTPFPSFYALLPVLGAVIFILSANKDTYVARILSTKVFVGIGLISYSAYLLHQPLFAYSKVLGFSSTIHAVTLTLFSLFLAYFFWLYIETPFRKHSKIGRVRLFAFSFAGLFFLT